MKSRSPATWSNGKRAIVSSRQTASTLGPSVLETPAPLHPELGAPEDLDHASKMHPSVSDGSPVRASTFWAHPRNPPPQLSPRAHVSRPASPAAFSGKTSC